MKKLISIGCTFSLFVFNVFAQPPSRQNYTTPFVLGVIDTIYSTELHEIRRLNIYLPEDYSSDSTYPVIYLLDGSANEDFIHIAGLVQFCNFPWVNILPKSIVVGIENVDRKRDFTFPTTIVADKKDFPTTGYSKKFIAFIENELQPFIQTNYKTNYDRMLIGQSLGGLLASEILYTKPQLFSKYLIVSPSLWWDNESLLKQKPLLLSASSNISAEVFIAVGKEGDVMENDAKQLVTILKNSNQKNVRVHFQYFSEENHATIFHNAVYKGFESFMLKK